MTMQRNPQSIRRGLTMSSKKHFIERDKKIYEMFCSGKSYVACSMEFEITDSGVRQALRRHRERNNLPNGRGYDDGKSEAAVI